MFKQIYTLVGFLVIIDLSFSQQCDIKFLNSNPGHTACLQTSTVGSGVTESELTEIVARHNFFRSRVHLYNNQPAATNMQKMYWDEELAMIAQKWADNCEWKHDDNIDRAVPGSYSVGQNLALGTRDWMDVVDSWQSEVEFLTFGVGGTPNKAIGHYTQVVWADSARIGCGFTDCDMGQMFVCNYAPAGNSGSEQFSPYKSGPQGSDCGAPADGLCDCGGKVCKNGGELDLQTCECKCKSRPWIVGNDCSFDCSQASDHSVCATKGGTWGPDKCRQFSNAPSEYCPVMCNLCPDSNTVQNTAPPTSPAPRTRPTTADTPSTAKRTTTVEVTTREASSTHVVTTKRRTTPSVVVTTEATTEEPTISVCSSIESAECGQPSSSYYLRASCQRSMRVRDRCPAMCGKCNAEFCQDYNGNFFEIGDQWTSDLGHKHTCTKKGVTSKRVVVTTEATTEEPTSSVCSSIESAKCGQPSSSYYSRKSCEKSMRVQDRCPAMCGTCTAEQCRDYDGNVYDIGDEWDHRKKYKLTCTPAGVAMKRGCYSKSSGSVFLPGGRTRFRTQRFLYNCRCKSNYRWSCRRTRNSQN